MTQWGPLQRLSCSVHGAQPHLESTAWLSVLLMNPQVSSTFLLPKTRHAAMKSPAAGSQREAQIKYQQGINYGLRCPYMALHDTVALYMDPTNLRC